MQVRRCAVVWMEPREVAHFELEDLLSGGTGVVGRLGWFAHAPHLPAPVEVDPAHVPLLGALGAVDWVERARSTRSYGDGSGRCPARSRPADRACRRTTDDDACG